MIIIIISLSSSYFAKISWLTKDGFSHEEAKNLTNSGYYDDDGNWVYYPEPAAEPAEKKVMQPFPAQPKTAQVKPPQNQQKLPLNNQQKPKTPHEVQAAKDEAQKAAQEAAKAAKEASKGLFKGLTSFGGNVKNQAQAQQQAQAQKGKAGGGGGLFGGIMKAAASTAAQAATGQPEPPKPKPVLKKPQNPNFPKPYTNNMTAKQRWQWAYRRIVQVN